MSTGRMHSRGWSIGAVDDDGSPIVGPMTCFPGYHARNGHRKKPKAVAAMVDHVKDKSNDGAADIDDVKLFLKKNRANRIALKGDAEGKYPGGDFRSPECVEFLKQADIVLTKPPVSSERATRGRMAA